MNPTHGLKLAIYPMVAGIQVTLETEKEDIPQGEEAGL